MRYATFAIDIRFKFPHVEDANSIRLAILHDELYEDDEALHRAEDLIIAIYDQNIGETKAYAKSFLRYLNNKYDKEMTIRPTLERLVKI